MSEADKRPLTERDKKILNEVRKVQKLRREQGCKILDCGVVTNNTNLRIEIIDLKRKVQEQEKIIELMVEKLSIYKFEEIICMEIECDHITLEQEGKCIGDKACILEYFRKKARGDKQ